MEGVTCVLTAVPPPLGQDHHLAVLCGHLALRVDFVDAKGEVGAVLGGAE